MTNKYCDILNIQQPALELVKDHREANIYSLLIVALLEHGHSMTLEEVADRFEEAGVKTAGRVLNSLKRCRPARAPVYRDGDRYALDPHDDELDLWAFRLGLRPPKVPRLTVVKTEPALPGPDVPLSMKEIAEAFTNACLGSNWSALRLAVAVLDAHGITMLGDKVIAALNRITLEHSLRLSVAAHWGRNAPIQISENGTWKLDSQHAAVRSARQAVRQRIEIQRRQQANRPDPAVMAAYRKQAERRQAEHRAELARLQRTLVYAFPAEDPEAVVLVNVNKRELITYTRSEFAAMRSSLVGVDVIGAINVRAILRSLAVEQDEFRLAELGPPQKTRQLNKAGRKLKISMSLLVRGSCGISKPFADPKRLRGYLLKGETTKFFRRIEADAKSLAAIYQYGRLHGAIRLKWGFIDEFIPVTWKHWDEPSLYSLIRTAFEKGCTIEVVTGNAPGWADPWSRVRRCIVEKLGDYNYTMFDKGGMAIDERDVQLARLH